MAAKYRSKTNSSPDPFQVDVGSLVAWACQLINLQEYLTTWPGDGLRRSFVILCQLRIPTKFYCNTWIQYADLTSLQTSNITATGMYPLPSSETTLNVSARVGSKHRYHNTAVWLVDAEESRICVSSYTALILWILRLKLLYQAQCLLWPRSNITLEWIWCPACLKSARSRWHGQTKGNGKVGPQTWR